MRGSAAATSLPVMAGCCEHTRSKASGIVARPKKAWERPLKVWTSLWCGRVGEEGGASEERQASVEAVVAQRDRGGRI